MLSFVEVNDLSLKHKDTVTDTGDHGIWTWRLCDCQDIKNHHKGVVVDNPRICVCCSQINKRKLYIINQAGQAGPAKSVAEQFYCVKFADVPNNYGAHLCVSCKRLCESYANTAAKLEKLRNTISNQNGQQLKSIYSEKRSTSTSPSESPQRGQTPKRFCDTPNDPSQKSGGSNPALSEQSSTPGIMERSLNASAALLPPADSLLSATPGESDHTSIKQVIVRPFFLSVWLWTAKPQSLMG